MNRLLLTTIGCGFLIQTATVAHSATPAAPAGAPVTSARLPSSAIPFVPDGSPSLAHSLNKAFGDVYEKISPGVVVVEAQEPSRAYDPRMNSPLMQFFGQDPNAQPEEGRTNQGSGFIITADGYILTNCHVLEGASKNRLQITLKDGRKFKASVAGIDPQSDLAVLKIEASGLPTVELGDSDRVRVGEFAFALGAPFELRYTFTYGIISAKGRANPDGMSRGYQEYLQTDASINPGNSGGPLVDIDGRVVGINTMIYGMDRGLGFAIPINIAKKIAAELIADGRVTRSWLGIGIADLEDYPQLAELYPDFPKGILVRGIYRGTPASLSGLQQADIITSVDGKPVANSRELQKAIFDKKVGDQVDLQVWRDNRKVDVKLRTAEHIENLMPVSNQRMAPNFDNDPADQDVPATQGPTTQSRPASPADGLQLRKVTADLAMAKNLQAEEGLYVANVQPGSAAAVAGVKEGDVITSVGKTPVRTREDFYNAIDSASGEEAVMLNLNRGESKTYAILKF